MSPSTVVRVQERRLSWTARILIPVIVLGGGLLLYHQATILFTSFAASWALYYLLNPMVDLLERQSIRRVVACIWILGAFVLILYLIWLRFLSFGEEFKSKVDLDQFQHNLISRVQGGVIWMEEKVPSVKNWVEPHLPKVKVPRGVKLTDKEYEEHQSRRLRVLIEEKLSDFLAKLFADYAPELAKTLFGLLPNLILIPYFTFFFLKDGKEFKRTVIAWVPNRYFEHALKFFHEMSLRMRSYLQSMLLDCLLIGTLFGTGCYFAGVPYPVVFGSMAFVLNSIPLVGPLLYGSISLLITLAVAPSNDAVLGLLLVFLFSRLCDDLILIPMLYGKSNKLHPVIVVCAVIMGESLAGVWGMFLAIPVTSIIFLGMQIIREISRNTESPPLPAIYSGPFA